MKPKTMILLGLAITCGLGASYMTSRLLAERQTPDAPETVDILIAKQDISVHTRLNQPEDLFEKKTVTKDAEPPDAIRDFAELKGKTLKTGRNRGDHITAANLFNGNGGLEVPLGHQAIGVRVNLETTAHGLASLPGKRVDLQLTIRAQNANDLKVIVLLENVLVLASDIQTDSEGKLAAPAQIVTFALTRKEVLKINGAMDLGTIRMIIRDPNDRSFAKNGELVITGSEITNQKKEEPKTEPTTPQIVAVQPKVEPKVEPKIEPEPVRPKLTKHYYDVINGANDGQRQVERVYYYLTEDGRTLPLDSPEVEEYLQTPPPPRTQTAPKKGGSGPREI